MVLMLTKGLDSLHVVLVLTARPVVIRDVGAPVVIDGVLAAIEGF